MPKKKYTGPNRREFDAATRRFHDSHEWRGRSTTAFMGDYSLSEAQEGLLTVKEEKVPTDRRIGGAGRRKDDFSRALKTGEPVVYDLSKSPKSAFKGLGKVAKKAAKHGGKLGLAISAGSALYDMVNKNK